MKKLLALVLALVMSMSLVTISNAAFSDAKDIEHTEAVEVMNALGVIAGLPDGSFGPEGNVTRAQMAKMITVIMLGDVDPAAFVGTTTDLTDVSGHWAEGYIKYCYSQGVIAGTGAGKFEPEANVTAVQAAKMLLVAIGYNADIQGYVGADWAINIIRDAQLSKLFDELSVTATQVLTRDDAAQMIYNAVNAKMIEKTPSINITNGQVTYSYQPGSKTLLKETFGVVRGDAKVMTAFSYDVEDKEYTYTVDGTGYKSETDYTDLFQQKVEVLYKDDKNVTVYGIYAKDSAVIVEGVIGDISDLDKLNDTTDEVKVSGTKYKVDVDKNGKNSITGAYAFGAASTTSFNKIGQMANFKAFSFKAIDNDDNGKIDTLVFFPFTVEEVTYAGVKSFTLKATGNYKYEKQDETFTLVGDLDKEDQVMVVAAANSSKGMTEISKLEVLNGKVVATNGTEKSKIGETWYKHTANAVKLDSKYDYAVVNGYLVYVDGSAASVKAEDYVLLAAHKSNVNTWGSQEVKLVYSDGTTEVKTYDKDDTDAKQVKWDNLKDKTLYTVDDTDNDGKVELFAVETTKGKDNKFGGFDGYTATKYEKKTDKAGKIDGIAIADDAIVFVWNTKDDEGCVIAGSELAKLSSATVKNAYYNTSDNTGFSEIVLAYVQTDMVSTTGTKYGYVVADVISSKNADSDTVATVTFWNGEEELTLTTDKTNASVLTKKGQAFSYKLDKDGNMTEVKMFADYTERAVTAYDGSSIEIANGTKTFDVDDDTVIIYVDTEDKAGVDGGKIALANKDENGKYINNVIIVADDDADITILFVDVANDYQYVGK